MITCVSVYLASGTISTLEHSEPGEHLIWKVWDSGSLSTVSPSLPASVNQSRSHLLFPKSIKGESSGGNVGSTFRVRGGDGSRSWSTNASFLLQKARVLRRGAEIDPSSSMNINDTLINTEAAESISSKTLKLYGSSSLLDNNGTTDDGQDIVTYATEGYHQANQTNKLCDVTTSSDTIGSGGSSLLYVRFQVNSGSYFTVCRQLWWHYVNMAGKNGTNYARFQQSKHLDQSRLCLDGSNSTHTN